MGRHHRGDLPARRAHNPEAPGWRPQDDVAAIRGILAAFAIYIVAGGLGVLVTWLLMHWGSPSR